MAVEWLKAKYATAKTTGRYRSGHNDAAKRRARRRLTDRERAELRARQPEVVLVLGSDMKKRFVRTPRT